MKRTMIRNHAIQEGILFLLLGGALVWHGLDSHQNAFNKDWSQSPYLFPVLVGVLVGMLSVSLLCQGVKAVHRGAKEQGNIPEGTNPSRRQVIQVLTVLAMSMLYYLALTIKIPYITIGILNWFLTISSFEIVTLIFLIAMMFYLGVRRRLVLVAVPLGATLFLSVAFRAMLHVLLP